MLNTLSIASDGYLYDRTPLSIASRGWLNIVDEDVVVVVPLDAGLTLGGTGYRRKPIKYKVKSRDKKYGIHHDDDEVLEILVQIVVSGIIN